LPSHKLKRILFRKELRNLFSEKALWIMLVILSLLTGYSFIQAVDLFSQASRTALQYPEMARGMTPLDGVFIPSFGALYLVTTLLFPFVAIQLISSEKRSGSLKLLVQSRLTLNKIIFVKVTTLAMGWLLVLTPSVSAIVIWIMLGGHAHLPAVLNLVTGYTLYALIITSIAFLATALTSSTATAAILTLTFTLGSWVLDFAAGTQGWLHNISALSLTSLLREFEHGLFSLSTAVQAALSIFVLLLLSVIWLNPGVATWTRLRRSLLVVLSWVLLSVPVSTINIYRDTTENRRNSFSTKDESALKQMDAGLTVTIYLSREDSRRHDFERNILSKLQRTVPCLEAVFPFDSTSSLPGTSDHDRYGLIEYDYNGNHEESWSNSPREVLPILHALAGQTVTHSDEQRYPGYPLVTDADPYRIWFYLILPLIFLALWWRSSIFQPKKQIEIEQ